MSTSRAGGRRGRSRKSPRIPSPRGYKGTRLVTRDDVVSQRHKFGSVFLSYFLGSQKLPSFFNFPITGARHKNMCDFIGRNFESRVSEVGLHKQKKDTASAKEGRVSLLRRGGQSQDCALTLNTAHGRPTRLRLGLGRLKILESFRSEITANL